jgi:hypothetical protein
VPYQEVRCYFPKSKSIVVPNHVIGNPAFERLEPLRDEDMHLFTLSLSANIHKVEAGENFKNDFGKFLRFCSKKDHSCDMNGVAGMDKDIKQYLKSHSIIEDNGKFDAASFIDLLQQQLPFYKYKDGKLGIFKQCAEISLNIGFDSQISQSKMLRVAYQARYNCAFADFRTPPNSSWFTHASGDCRGCMKSFDVVPVIAMLLAMSCRSDTIIQYPQTIPKVTFASHEREIEELSSDCAEEAIHRLSSVKDGTGKLVDAYSMQPDHHLKQLLHDAKIGPLVV